MSLKTLEKRAAAGVLGNRAFRNKANMGSALPDLKQTVHRVGAHDSRDSGSVAAKCAAQLDEIVGISLVNASERRAL